MNQGLGQQHKLVGEAQDAALPWSFLAMPPQHFGDGLEIELIDTESGKSSSGPFFLLGEVARLPG